MTTSLLIIKITAIIISCMILLNAYLMKRYAKTWLFPPCIFALFWFAFTFFPLVGIIEAPINPFAILYIFFCTVIFSISSLHLNWKKAFLQNSLKSRLEGNKRFNTLFLKVVFILGQLYVLTTIPINLNINNLQITDYLSNFLQSNNLYLAKRYSGTIVSNIYFRTGTVINYLGLALGGILLPFCRNKIAHLILSFLPSVLFMLLYADKGTLFLGIVIFYGGILINRIHNNELSPTTKKTNITSLAVSLIILPIVAISFIARDPDYQQLDQLIFILKRYFASYAFAHIYAFSDWFSYHFFTNSFINEYIQHLNTFGFYTFTKIYNLLNPDLIPIPGIYGEYFFYKNIFKSNIYTIFRGLISDYGFAGSLIFIYLSGLLFNIAYHSMLIAKRPIISLSIFIVMLATFYTSFIISIFIWNSIIIFGILLALVLFLNKIKFKL